MAEYFRQFRTDLIEGQHWQDILLSGQSIDRITLREFLFLAKRFLILEPGPNLETRQKEAENWLGWWVRYLSSGQISKGILKPASLVPFKDVAKIVSRDTAGVLFVAGLEGHRGHRWAVEWMLGFVNRPVILFEQDEFFAEKARKGPFLPLEVRLSMWSYYNPNLIISVSPLRNPSVPESDHYQNLFTKTSADFCFAEAKDPNQAEKRARGKSEWFTQIPTRPILRTTRRGEN